MAKGGKRSIGPPSESIPEALDECQRSIAVFQRHIRRLVQCRKEHGDIFLMEFGRRLLPLFLIKKREPAIERLVRFVAEFATFRQAGMEEEADAFAMAFLGFLLAFVEAREKAARFRAAQLIAEILNHMPEEAELADDLWEDLLNVLRKRVHDRFALVRVYAVKALARLVDPGDSGDFEGDPTVTLYRDLLVHENSPDVRKAVVAAFPISVTTIPDVLARISDADDGVRKIAFKVLAKKIPLRTLSIAQRVTVLKRGLQDRVQGVRDECVKMMRDFWLVKDCNADVCELLRLLDVETYEEVGELVLEELLKQGLVKAKQGMGIQQYFASADEDVGDAPAVELDLPANDGNTNNQKSGRRILLMVAEEALFWRILCTYLYNQAKEQGSSAAGTTGAQAELLAANATEHNDALEGILPATIADYVQLVEAHLRAAAGATPVTGPVASSSNTSDRLNALEIDFGALKDGAQLQQTATQQLEQWICTVAANPSSTPCETTPKFDGQEIFCDSTKTDSIPWFPKFELKLQLHHVSEDKKHEYLYSRSGGACQAWLDNLLSKYGVVAADLYTKISWDDLKAAWHERFQVEPLEIKAMDKLLTFEQGMLPTVDWIAEYQRLTSVLDIQMGFTVVKHYFITRSCSTVGNALTHVEDTLTTTAELFDKAAQIIVTNKEAKNLNRFGLVVGRQGQVVKLSTAGSESTTLSTPSEPVASRVTVLRSKAHAEVDSPLLYSYEDYAARLVPTLGTHAQGQDVCAASSPSGSGDLSSSSGSSWDSVSEFNIEVLDPLTLEDFAWLPLSTTGRLSGPQCAALCAHLHTYLSFYAPPTSPTDDEAAVGDILAYVTKVARKFRKQRYDDNNAPLLYVRIQVGQASCSALLDSGATRNFMSQAFMQRAGLGAQVRRKANPTTIKLADERTQQLIDRYIEAVPVYFASYACEPVTFDILDTAFDIILGMPRFASVDHTTVAVADSSPTDFSADPRVVRLLDEFTDIFELPTGVVPDWPISHEIILEAGAVPLKGCIYDMSDHAKAPELVELLQMAKTMDFTDAAGRSCAAALAQKLLQASQWDESSTIEGQNNPTSAAWCVGDGIHIGGEERWTMAIAEFTKQVHAGRAEFQTVLMKAVIEMEKKCRADGGQNFQMWAKLLAVLGLLLLSTHSLKVLSRLDISPAEMLRTIITPLLNHSDPVICRAAVRCLALYCHLDIDATRKYGPVLHTMIANGAPVVKMMAARSVFDLILCHGIAALDAQNVDESEATRPTSCGAEQAETEGRRRRESCSESVMFGGPPAQGSLLNIMAEHLACDDSLSEDTEAEGCEGEERGGKGKRADADWGLNDTGEGLKGLISEGFAKLLLCQSLFKPGVLLPDPELALARLLRVYFSPKTAKCSRMRQCLYVFFENYAVADVENQRCIARVFLPLLRLEWPGVRRIAADGSVVSTEPISACAPVLARKKATDLARFMLSLLQKRSGKRANQDEGERAAKGADDDVSGNVDDNEGSEVTLENSCRAEDEEVCQQGEDVGHERLALALAEEIIHCPSQKTVSERHYVATLGKIIPALAFRLSHQEEIKCMRNLLPRVIASISGDAVVVKELKVFAGRLRDIDKSPSESLSEEDAKTLLQAGLRECLAIEEALQTSVRNDANLCQPCGPGNMNMESTPMKKKGMAAARRNTAAVSARKRPAGKQQKSAQQKRPWSESSSSSSSSSSEFSFSNDEDPSDDPEGESDTGSEEGCSASPSSVQGSFKSRSQTGSLKTPSARNVRAASTRKAQTAQASTPRAQANRRGHRDNDGDTQTTASDSAGKTCHKKQGTKNRGRSRLCTPSGTVRTEQDQDENADSLSSALECERAKTNDERLSAAIRRLDTAQKRLYTPVRLTRISDEDDSGSESVIVNGEKQPPLTKSKRRQTGSVQLPTPIRHIRTDSSHLVGDCFQANLPQSGAGRTSTVNRRPQPVQRSLQLESVSMPRENVNILEKDADAGYQHHIPRGSAKTGGCQSPQDKNGSCQAKHGVGPQEDPRDASEGAGKNVAMGGTSSLPASAERAEPFQSVCEEGNSEGPLSERHAPHTEEDVASKILSNVELEGGGGVEDDAQSFSQHRRKKTSPQKSVSRDVETSNSSPALQKEGEDALQETSGTSMTFQAAKQSADKDPAAMNTVQRDNPLNEGKSDGCNQRKRRASMAPKKACVEPTDRRASLAPKGGKASIAPKERGSSIEPSDARELPSRTMRTRSRQAEGESIPASATKVQRNRSRRMERAAECE
ncbi:hypothetical protein CBR_g39392 [Chara braunii]|uniref:Nuclear condensin complex subunit 3 C-terminal domain-containing protein n=1 Tax=Chara braunii TaxID=69332 RepID=A0A388LRP6_CHABU|nr:hypothetical protein CBR_g39392 [Chara braunii]|eukprot:GBG84929.1 hypothetical protein CBR_g39392 [Chara braunii]